MKRTNIIIVVIWLIIGIYIFTTPETAKVFPSIVVKCKTNEDTGAGVIGFCINEETGEHWYYIPENERKWV